MDTSFNLDIARNYYFFSGLFDLQSGYSRRTTISSIIKWAKRTVAIIYQTNRFIIIMAQNAMFIATYYWKTHQPHLMVFLFFALCQQGRCCESDVNQTANKSGQCCCQNIIIGWTLWEHIWASPPFLIFWMYDIRAATYTNFRENIHGTPYILPTKLIGCKCDRWKKGFICSMHWSAYCTYYFLILMLQWFEIWMRFHKHIRKQYHDYNFTCIWSTGGNHYTSNLNYVLHFYYFISVSGITEKHISLNFLIPISQGWHRMKWHFVTWFRIHQHPQPLSSHIITFDKLFKDTTVVPTFSPLPTRSITAALINGISYSWVHVSSWLGEHFEMFRLRSFLLHVLQVQCVVVLVQYVEDQPVPSHTVRAKVLVHKSTGFQQCTVAHFKSVPVLSLFLFAC